MPWNYTYSSPSYSYSALIPSQSWYLYSLHIILYIAEMQPVCLLTSMMNHSGTRWRSSNLPFGIWQALLGFEGWAQYMSTTENHSGSQVVSPYMLANDNRARQIIEANYLIQVLEIQCVLGRRGESIDLGSLRTPYCPSCHPQNGSSVWLSKHVAETRPFDPLGL